MKRLSVTLVSLITLVGLLAILPAESAWPAQKLTGKLNINTATAGELALLPLVGSKKAQDIIKLRDEIKGFKRLDDVLKVRGIGKKQFAKMEPYMKLDGASDLKGISGS